MRREPAISSLDIAQFRVPWGQGHALIVVLGHSRLIRLVWLVSTLRKGGHVPVRECEWDTPGGFAKSGPDDSLILREAHNVTPGTGKMGRMSVPDIHEERLETLRKRAVDRLRRRHSYRCPHCSYRGVCPNCPRCGEFCESGHGRRSIRR